MSLLPLLSGTDTSGTIQLRIRIASVFSWFGLVWFGFFLYPITDENVVSVYCFGDKILTSFYILGLVMNLQPNITVLTFLRHIQVFTIFLPEIVYSTTV